MDAKDIVFNISPEEGLIRPAEQVHSPNQDDRPDSVDPELIIIHGISLPPGEFGGPYIEQLFTNTLEKDDHPYFCEIADLKVSSHLLLRRDGSLIQFVPFTRRAWHAGRSRYRGRPDCNDFSIGIELEGDDETPYTDSQYDVLPNIISTLTVTYSGLCARRIAGHCDVSPGRKSDPGPAFDWLRLYDGLGDNTEES
jgi:AmpD protein